MGLRFDGRPNRDDLIERAQSGDREARDDILRAYTPFILRVASQVRGRYIRQGEDEEVSVGLLALDEAIDAYAPARGAFLAFAQTVIRRRLIDHYRRHAKGQDVLISELEREDTAEAGPPTVLDLAAVASWQKREQDEERRMEIGELSRLLDTFGIRFDDLPRHCPRHQDARVRVLRIAAQLAGDPKLARDLLRHGTLPLAELSRRTGATRKMLERHRRYIIAVALIHMNDWPELRSYVRPVQPTQPASAADARSRRGASS
jgi:RNA polymerase sigma factor